MINHFQIGHLLSRVPQFCGVRTFGLFLSLVASILVLSACAEEPSVLMEFNQSDDQTGDQIGGLTTSFNPPDMLVQSREIDQNALRLRIVVNGREYPVDINANSESSPLTIRIAQGEQLDIVVIWSELYNGQPLVLAQAEENTTVPINDLTTFEITIDTDDYTTNFDDDLDDRTNLDERNNGTDPRVANSPVTQVPVRLRASTPEQLTGIESDIDETLTAVADVDGVIVQLNREGDTWVGETNKPANSDQLINYTFYSSIRQNVTLAMWQGRRNVGDTGTTVEIQSNEYDYEFDIDGDGTNNLQEVLQGSNPEDRNDPPPDACDISNFEIGCDNDTDGDGIADSIETEDADADEDSIPDYRESRNDDADEDGFNAELDRDESDPCVPSEEATACEDEGPMQPPVIEPPEASPLSYDLFEGQFASLPDFSRLTPASSGSAETFSLIPGNGANFYALRFTGQLFVDEAAEYTFFTESDDGSRLFINGSLVVDNDGTHSRLEASGVIALPAGLHNIVLEYFQNDGLEALTVSWSSSDITKQAIPENVLFAP